MENTSDVDVILIGFWTMNVSHAVLWALQTRHFKIEIQMH